VYGKILAITNHQRNAIKTTVGYHLTLVRMTVIKKTDDNKSWRRCGGKGVLAHFWECKLVQPLWKTVRGILKKQKWTSVWSSKEMESICQRIIACLCSLKPYHGRVQVFPFCFVFFRWEPHSFCPGWSWTLGSNYPPAAASWAGGTTEACHRAQIRVQVSIATWLWEMSLTLLCFSFLNMEMEIKYKIHSFSEE
jgi:hypothetical protein